MRVTPTIEDDESPAPLPPRTDGRAEAMARPSIELVAASRSFGRHIVLPTTSTTFVGGTSVALIGPNGSGKTTLLRLLAGLDDPTSGTIRRLRADGSAPRIAYVSQDRAEHDWMPITASEVVRMGRYAHRGLLGRFRRADRSAISDAMHSMAVNELAHRNFTELSGGQQQRVLVARALAAQPDILLMDEPITGLDEPTQEVILTLVERLAAEGVLVMISTHHLDEASRCDRVLLVDHGVIADGPPATVLAAGSLAQVFRANQIDVHGDTVSLFDEHGHGHDHDPEHAHATERPGSS